MKNLKRILNLLSKTLVLSWITYQGFLPGVTSSTDVLTEYHLELACVQELLFYEGRGTGSSGMTKIAQVLQNRKNSSKFQKSYCGVSKAKRQFSFHQDKHNQTVDKRPYSLDNQAWHTAGTIALLTVNNALDDPFRGFGVGTVMYYHSKEVKPSWSLKMKQVLTDKYHVFLKEHSKVKTK